MLAKIVSDNKKIDLFLGVDTQKALQKGFLEMEVEQAYDGQWYLKGYAPEKPVEEKETEVRAVRNQYLTETDKYMIVDYPITEEEEAQYIQYREYLRNYPETENWYENLPKDFSTWKEMLTEEE